MIAHTWEHHPDYESLCKALKMLQSVTDFVNKDIATSSALTKVLHIQNSLGGEVQVRTTRPTYCAGGRRRVTHRVHSAPVGSTAPILDHGGEAAVDALRRAQSVQ
jgi:hypothetical protein